MYVEINLLNFFFKKREKFNKKERKKERKKNKRIASIILAFKQTYYQPGNTGLNGTRYLKQNKALEKKNRIFVHTQ